MPISDFVINFKQAFELAEAEMPAKAAWKWAGKELSFLVMVLVKRPDGSIRIVKSGPSWCMPLRRIALPAPSAARFWKSWRGNEHTI